MPWGETEQTAFDRLKELLCQSTREPLYIIDFDKPFELFVDASGYAVSAILAQYNEHGVV